MNALQHVFKKSAGRESSSEVSSPPSVEVDEIQEADSRILLVSQRYLRRCEEAQRSVRLLNERLPTYRKTLDAQNKSYREASSYPPRDLLSSAVAQHSHEISAIKQAASEVSSSLTSLETTLSYFKTFQFSSDFFERASFVHPRSAQTLRSNITTLSQRVSLIEGAAQEMRGVEKLASGEIPLLEGHSLRNLQQMLWDVENGVSYRTALGSTLQRVSRYIFPCAVCAEQAPPQTPQEDLSISEACPQREPPSISSDESPALQEAQALLSMVQTPEFIQQKKESKAPLFEAQSRLAKLKKLTLGEEELRKAKILGWEGEILDTYYRHLLGVIKAISTLSGIHS